MIWWTATSLISSWWSPYWWTSSELSKRGFYFAIYIDFYFIYWLSWADSLESLNEAIRFSSWTLSWWWWWDFAEDLVLIQRISGFGISIHGTQINEIINKLYWRDYWDYKSHKGFPSVDPRASGRAIIWPIIEGAAAVSLSIPQAMVHL